MGWSVRWFRGVLCVGLAACGYPELTVAGSDAGIDAGQPVAPRSCAGLPMTCGANGNDGCCDSPAVAGGSYYRSYDRAGDAGSGDLTAPAMVHDFRLDRYEVTVARFRAFVERGWATQLSPPPPGAGSHARISNSGWDASWNAALAADPAALTAAVKCGSMLQTWTDLPGANDNRPINCVTWYEAMAFCAWDGGRLPTEAEWNYASTGGDQQRAYPWSDAAEPLAIDSSRASYGDSGVPPMCSGDGMPGCAFTDLVEVGTRPAGNGRWGQSDLAGNVAEWVLDWYAPSYPGPCTDCAKLTPAAPKVYRGGSLISDATQLRTAARRFIPPATRAYFHGIRCARAP